MGIRAISTYSAASAPTPQPGRGGYKPPGRPANDNIPGGPKPWKPGKPANDNYLPGRTMKRTGRRMLRGLGRTIPLEYIQHSKFYKYEIEQIYEFMTYMFGPRGKIPGAGEPIEWSCATPTGGASLSQMHGWGGDGDCIWSRHEGPNNPVPYGPGYKAWEKTYEWIYETTFLHAQPKWWAWDPYNAWIYPYTWASGSYVSVSKFVTFPKIQPVDMPGIHTAPQFRPLFDPDPLPQEQPLPYSKPKRKPDKRPNPKRSPKPKRNPIPQPNTVPGFPEPLSPNVKPRLNRPMQPQPNVVVGPMPSIRTNRPLPERPRRPPRDNEPPEHKMKASAGSSALRNLLEFGLEANDFITALYYGMKKPNQCAGANTTVKKLSCMRKAIASKGVEAFDINKVISNLIIMQAIDKGVGTIAKTGQKIYNKSGGKSPTIPGAYALRYI